MATIDPEILYLILTKVARKETFYGYDPSRGVPGQISARDLGAVYERITGSRVGARVNWSAHFSQLDLLLSHCGLPALSKVVRLESGPESSSEAVAKILD